MTFRGLHEHSLDPKDRITVPAQYRAALAEGIVLMTGIEPCVEIWPASAAERMEGATLSALNPMSRDARRIQRRFFAHSESLGARLRRPRPAQQAADRARPPRRPLHRSPGWGPRLEIWTPEHWFAEDEENEKKTPELTESLARTHIAGAGSPGAR